MTTHARNRTNAAWLREQLEDLRWSLALADRPPGYAKQALADILAGRPWRPVPQ